MNSTCVSPYFNPFYDTAADNAVQAMLLLVTLACSILWHGRWISLWVTLGVWSVFQALLCTCSLTGIACNGISIIYCSLMGFGAGAGQDSTRTRFWMVLFLAANAASISFILQDLLTLVAHLCAFAAGFLSWKASLLDRATTGPKQRPEPDESQQALLRTQTVGPVR
ncbi:hypothetical protein HDV03_001017 [Kappamyces sp. JEL0829]|nr:hypothetical protein HDV03_001017 [Kappamyces sp. JEL0829]